MSLINKLPLVVVHCDDGELPEDVAVLNRKGATVGRRMRVAVVGGGIGGLSAALALFQRGIGVTVYEQAAQLGEIGAGVMITPNGFRLLERMGLGPRLRAVGTQIGDSSQYYRHDGTPAAPVVTTDSRGWNAMFAFHRADLISVIASALPASSIQTGKRCINFTQNAAAAELGFQDGSRSSADAVIAADGIQSLLQGYVVTAESPLHSGTIAFRGLLPASAVDARMTEGVHCWMGYGKHFLTFPVRSAKLVNFVAFLPSSVAPSESWSAPGDPATLASEFRDWDPRLVEFVSEIDSTFWWGIYDRRPLPTWVNGRLALLGDAAHPMYPHLGQGANQAIEDAVAATILLGRAEQDSVAAALHEYQATRQPRTAQMQTGSRAQVRRTESRSVDLDARDAELAATASFRAGIYSYDVEVAVNERIANAV